MKHRLGLHIRLEKSLIDAAEKAVRLELPFFQCFFTQQETGRLQQFTHQEIVLFMHTYRDRFTQLYVHGSYWINLAGITYNGYRSFQREITLAKRLSFTHMVIHPGSAKGAQHKQEGIEAFARSLNTILKHEHDIQLVIENTAHCNMTVGSDINDFKKILALCDYPEKLTFALDTAHAYVYGYDISTIQGQDMFIQLIHDTIGLERVTLIHLNDSSQPHGSCIDKHAVPGEGLIGETMLQRFASHTRFKSVPIILELPILSEDQEARLLQKVGSWLR